MIIRVFVFVFFFAFWLHRAACGILVPRPGTEPKSPALSLNHWTAREVPMIISLYHKHQRIKQGLVLRVNPEDTVI